MNDIVYSDLLLSLNDEVCFGIVNQEKTTALKEGDTRMAWTDLNEKFDSSSLVAYIQLRK